MNIKQKMEFPWRILHSFGVRSCIVPAKFQSRGHAESHAQTLRRMAPKHQFEVVYLPWEGQ